MIGIETDLLIPSAITILISIAQGLYHKNKSNKAGSVIERFGHSVFHKGEILSYILICSVLYGLAWHMNESLVVLTTLIILAALAKYKMSQDIIVSEQGVLIRGKFVKWIHIRKVTIQENGLVHVQCKKTSFDISEMSNKEDFLKISKTYIVSEWFYANDE